MSGATELTDLYSAIEESARVMDVPCSRDKVWPFLVAYEDFIAQAVIAFRMATDARHAGELNCHILSLPKDVDPYAIALSNGLTPETDHPVGSLISDIGVKCPIDSYGCDFGVVGGFQKTWSFFPEDDFQNLSKIAEIPSMPRSLAENIGFFTSRDLGDKVSLIGIDYEHKTVNVYFGELPDERLKPKEILLMHREIGLPDPSNQMLKFSRQAFGFYVTLSWESSKIERISFPVMAPDLISLAVQRDLKIEKFMRRIPYGVDTPNVVYAALTSTGEEYYKFQSYYRWRPRILDLMQISGSEEPA